MPTLSIIIPVYNTVQYLQKCINSILSQSFKDFEIILVDDGSTDGSSVLCDQLSKIHESINCLHINNGGASRARNVGIDNAKGKYIAFVDSDDELYPYTYEVMVNGISKKGIDLVFGGMTWIKDGCVTDSPNSIVERIMGKQEILNYFRRPLYGRSIPGVVLGLFRANIIKDNHIRFSENIFSKEDFLFNTTYVLSMTGNSCLISKPVYKYMIRSSNSTSSMANNFNDRFPTGYDATELIYKMMREKGMDLSLISEDLINTYLRVKDYYLSFGECVKAEELKKRFFHCLPYHKYCFYRNKRLAINLVKSYFPYSFYQYLKNKLVCL